MNYYYIYKTPNDFDNLIMVSDGKYLNYLIFDKSKDKYKLPNDLIKKDINIFKETSKYLDDYFKGLKPNFNIPYKLNNLTLFRKEVIDELIKIPYGITITYGDIAKKIAKRHHLDKMSAQAVGNAVGYNPICIGIPCHRVIGSSGSLTGYGGGLNNKIELLKLEGSYEKM